MEVSMHANLASKGIFKVVRAFGIDRRLSDEQYLRMQYKALMGKRLDLDSPRTFNEKLQWLKLHDRNPLYTKLVDKYAVKEWVADRIGEECVVPTYARWERAEDIDISGLPERFVLKTNHDCGGIAICRDWSTFDLDAARRKLSEHLSRNYYWGCREWPYKDVVPCVFAEECLDAGASASDLTDYKFMCFGGQARCVFTCTGRAEGDLRVDFFDADWNHLPFERHYPNADATPERPACLSEMLRAAEVLAKGIPFVRVDFYDVASKPIFGEMTFYPGAGFEEFTPEKWDTTLGIWIDLSAAHGR